MRRAFVSVAVAAVLALAACGGGGRSDNPTIAGGAGRAKGASCAPTGTQLSISASDISFNKGCLAAPADQPFTIAFDNKEGLPHDVTIDNPQGGDPLFKGEIFTGPKSETYQVKGLPAGTYHFKCSVHPTQMQGTLLVRPVP